jgi:hypothetical protein
MMLVSLPAASGGDSVLRAVTDFIVRPRYNEESIKTTGTKYTQRGIFFGFLLF